MSRRLQLVGGAAVAVLLACARGLAAADDPAAALARMPRPWQQPVNRFTAEEYDATLRYWAEKHADRLTLVERGRSGDGYPLWLLDLTAKSVPDADKSRVLITGLHCGPERTGATTIMHLVQWLLSDDAEARQTLQRQRVLAMPVMNPHGCFAVESNNNAAGLPVYDGRRGKMFDIPTLTLLEPEKTPELRAFFGVVDEFQPEVHADIHGVTLLFNGQLVSESVGSAGSNHALRPWNWRISEAMIDAAQQAGYPSDRFEADAQRMLWGPELEPHAAKLWMGRVFFYPGTYPYLKYHTLPILTENGWEEGGAARLKGLLRAGNQRAIGQPDPGYPVDRVKALGGHFLAAYGQTAAARRRSRIELWNRQSSLTLGLLYPQCDCRALMACAVTAAGRAAITPRDPRQPALTPAGLVEQLQSLPGVNVAALKAFVDAGPETRLYLEPPQAPSDQPIEQGLAIVLRLSYARPELLDVRLNGQRLEPSRSDGYETWLADGFTHLQFNVPPAKSRTADVLIASVAYKPEVQRTYGWRPPAEVLRRLEAAQEPSR